MSSPASLSDPAFWELPREERDETFTWLRDHEPVSWQEPPTTWAPTKWSTPNGYWAVTRYDDIREVSRDSKTFPSGHGVLFFDNLPPDIEYGFSGWLSTDPPRHTLLRRLVSKAFTPRGVGEIKQIIENEARKAITRVAPEGRCDFIHGLARPFAISVTCALLGVPESDRLQIERLVNRSGDWGEGKTDGAIEAGLETARYGAELGLLRRRHPTDDLMTDVAQAEIDGKPLSDVDLGACFWTVLSAGFDTVAASASFAMVEFARHRDAVERWKSSYDRLAPTAIEEILRWATPVMNFRRVAVEDTELAGRRISRGDNIVVWYISGNRDERVFEHPWRFDLERDPNPHVAFGGGGSHFCLGHALARSELTILFREVFQRLPDIELSDDPVPYTNPFVETFEVVPVSFTAVEPADSLIAG